MPDMTPWGLNEVLVNSPLDAGGAGLYRETNGFDPRFGGYREAPDAPLPGFGETSGSGVLDNQELEQLALELMTLSNEREAEEFLGGLFDKVGEGLKSVASSVANTVVPAAAHFIAGPGRELLAKALPLVGAGLGTFLGPGIGTSLGGMAGNFLGNMVGGKPTPSLGGLAQGAFGALSGPGGPLGSLGGAGGANPLAGLFGGAAGGGNPLAGLLGGAAGGGNPLAGLMGGGAGGGNPLAGLLGGAAGGGNPLAGLLGGAAGGGSPLAALLGGAAGGGNPLAALLGGGGGNPLLSLLGSGLGGNLLGGLFGGEMESAPLPEVKTELARRIVRTLVDATHDAVTNPAAVRDPSGVARSAFAQALQRHVPSGVRAAMVAATAVPALAAPASGPASAFAVAPVSSPMTPVPQGAWYRHGGHIVLVGAGA